MLELGYAPVSRMYLPSGTSVESQGIVHERILYQGLLDQGDTFYE